MVATPVDIRRRPFSVEPVTGVMMPDGIFDTAIFTQRITCHVTNTSGAPLTNVEIYLEAVGDPAILPRAKTVRLARLEPGASALVFWLADFRNATPGKKPVSIIAQAEGMTP